VCLVKDIIYEQNTLLIMSNDINSIKSCMYKSNNPNGTTFMNTLVNTQKNQNIIKK